MKPENNDYTFVSQHLVMTEHLNPNHVIFGGQLLAWLDKDLYIYVSTKMKYKSFVTLSMNEIRFRKPANLGDILQIFGKIEEVKRSSVKTLGKALAFDPVTGDTKEIIDCQVTYVAVNEQGKPNRIFDVGNS